MGMAGLIFGATFLAYLPAVHGGFLWDDEGHVTKPELQSFHGLVRIWGEVGATQQYYPLLHSAFWVEHRLWGDSLVGYHLMNLLLHAGAACLVVAIMRRLALPGAGLAGLLFALHPVCVESVAWISEQKNTLSAVFYLGAMLAYLHFDRDRRRSHYYLALGLFLLALLSKTVTATLPAALLVIFWWQRARLDWRRDVLPLAPWLLLGACGGLFSAWMERTIIGAGGAEFALTPVQRGLVAGRAICFYLGKLAWPADLMFIYPRWNVNPAVGWQYLFPLAVLVLLAALGWVARRRRGPLAAFLLFVGTLFPSLGFLNVYPFVFSYVADHFQYLACLGILAPVASMLTAATARLPTATRRAIPILGGVLLTMLAVLTWRQSTQYGDAETLFRETLARNPACWMAHNNLGNILAKIPGRLPEAMAHYESALQTRPDFAEAHFNLANALAETPEHRPEAIVHYEAALRGKPDYPEAHNNLGETLAKIPERRPQAIAQFEAALRINPEFAEAHNNLGVALSSAPDRRPQAIAQFEAALRARPDFAEAHFNLANLLAKTPDRLPEAIAQYEAALRGKPDFAEAHFNLGWVLLRMPDRQQDGLAHFEAALRIQPDLAPAREMLDRLRAIQR
jgi:tetratricopeptide (TPR) repeat protein